MPAKTIIMRLKHVTIARRATVKCFVPFCPVSPAVAQCAFSIRNSILPTLLVVLLNRTAGVSASFFEYFQLLCKHRLACQCRKTRHRKLGSPAKSSGPFLGPKNRLKTVPFKLGLPSFHKRLTLMILHSACRACLSSLASVACMVQPLPDLNCAGAQTFLWVDVWSFRRGAVPACVADVP